MNQIENFSKAKPKVIKTFAETLEILKRIIREEEVDQDFIFLTGLNRYEYNAEHKSFVVETRQFDRIPMEEKVDESKI